MSELKNRPLFVQEIFKPSMSPRVDAEGMLRMHPFIEEFTKNPEIMVMLTEKNEVPENFIKKYPSIIFEAPQQVVTFLDNNGLQEVARNTTDVLAKPLVNKHTLRDYADVAGYVSDSELKREFLWQGMLTFLRNSHLFKALKKADNITLYRKIYEYSGNGNSFAHLQKVMTPIQRKYAQKGMCTWWSTNPDTYGYTRSTENRRIEKQLDELMKENNVFYDCWDGLPAVLLIKKAL